MVRNGALNTKPLDEGADQTFDLVQRQPEHGA